MPRSAGREECSTALRQGSTNVVQSATREAGFSIMNL
jgi:hypothetical protein